MARRHCVLCREKPARRLKASQPYEFAVTEATFCSRQCAADWALIHIGFNDEYWCKECGSWETCCKHHQDDYHDYEY